MSEPAPVTKVDLGRRMARYREIVGILWDERLYEIVGIGGSGQPAAEPPSSAPSAAETDPVEVRVRRAIERLGPAFIKAGQLLATRRDVISPALAVELGKLQDDVPPIPYEAVEARVEEELGASLSELFGSFDREPLAAASIGQVHRATLPDGRRVVVKVQRPGVSDQMAVDLDIIERQARTAGKRLAWARTLDVPGMAGRFVEALRSELDYRVEARNMDFFYEAFQADDRVVIPQVDWDRTTVHVLTMDELQGIPSTDSEGLDRAGVDRKGLVQTGVEAYFRQIFVLGRFHADPHQGNLFAMPGGRVGFVDFGRVGTISERDQDRALDLVSALLDADEMRATQVLLETTHAGPDVDRAAIRIEVADLIDSYLSTAQTITFDGIFQRLFGMIRRYELTMPNALAVLFVTLGTLEGVATALDPGFRFAEAARPIAEKLVPQRWREHGFQRALRRVGPRYIRLAEDLPDLADGVLRRASEGEFRIAVRPTETDDLVRELERIVSRLAYAIILAAVVLATAILLAGSRPSPEAEAAITILAIATILTVLWLLFSSVRRHR